MAEFNFEGLGIPKLAFLSNYLLKLTDFLTALLTHFNDRILAYFSVSLAFKGPDGPLQNKGGL